MKLGQKSESGISVVIAFIFLLMLIVGIIGIWGIIGLPVQMENARNVHLMEVQNSMIEYKLATDMVRVNDLEGARVNVLLPAASVTTSGSVSFDDDTGGQIIIKADSKTKIFNVSRLSTTLSGGSGKVTVGYENGGIFRDDYGRAAWITPGLLQIYNATDSLPITEIVLVNLTGKPDVMSNQYVPLTSVYKGRDDNASVSWNGTATITFTSKDLTQLNLWKTMFDETRRRWISYGGIPDYVNYSSYDSSAILTLKIPDGSSKTPLYIREVTYDISITQL